jgi:hypothetical protein
MTGPAFQQAATRCYPVLAVCFVLRYCKMWHPSAMQVQKFDTVEESLHTKGGMNLGHSPQQNNTTYWHSNELTQDVIIQITQT